MAIDKKFVAVGNIICKSINKAGIGRQVEAARVCDYYHQALIKTDINKKALDQSKAIYYSNKILTVAVLGSAWAQEIQMRQHIIVEKINAYFRKEIVNRINFKIG